MLPPRASSAPKRRTLGPCATSGSSIASRRGGGSPFTRGRSRRTRPSTAPLEIDATEALAVVRELRERSGVKVTITHLVGHALAVALGERPEVNAIVRFGELWQRETIDVFFQVAFEGGENLSGHKVERADEKDVVTIARELVEGAAGVRKGKAANVKASKKFSRVPPFLLGLLMAASSFLTYDLGLDLTALGVPYDGFGSAMVTSVGGFGLGIGLPPLVPFSRCPLVVLVGEVEERAVVRDGAVVARPILPLGVTFDHRVLDGYQAGVMTKKFRAVLERPRETLKLQEPAPVASA